MPAELARPISEFSKKELRSRGKTKRSTLAVRAQNFDLLEASDIPLEGPESVHRREVISLRTEDNAFKWRNGYVVGVHDGRDALAAGVTETTKGGLLGDREIKVVFTGIDTNPWKAALAQENLLKAGVPEDRLQILIGDGIRHLQASSGMLEGWHMAFLPQTPQNEKARTMPRGAKKLAVGPHGVDEYGLLPSAAYLRALRERVSERSDVQLTLSGRVPKNVRDELFIQTGWFVLKTYGRIVRLNPATDIQYVTRYAQDLDHPGDGFFESTYDRRRFVPISPAEAVERQQAFAAGELNEESFNVRHYVFEYVAQPTEVSRREEIELFLNTQ